MTDGTYLYVEMWNAKPAWLALNAEQRADFMENKVEPFMQSIVSADCAPHGCCVNDGDSMPRAGYAFLVVWKVSSKEEAKKLANGTAGIGFYEYFDSVNIGGPQIDTDELKVRLRDL
ncbi:hypothetical protein AB833_27855 [Chromatiales bacterium (ex Bugula neritina AB1)]|nr:hypothetical protein AB833_27855 [Chromatiales bacterium (ex Bugula neritina AB1)]